MGVDVVAPWHTLPQHKRSFNDLFDVITLGSVVIFITFILFLSQRPSLYGLFHFFFFLFYAL